MTRQGFDSAYIARLGERDPQTEGHFCAYFGELILIKARARRLSPTLAEEVRQDTFERVIKTLRTPGALRSAESLGAFVNSVCNNVLRERFRDQKRHQPPAEEPAPLPDTVTPSPEAQLITKERQEAVRRVIAAMSPEKARVLREVLLAERDREEVCRELDVSPEYLRVLLYRAKQEFRALYAGGAIPLPRATSDRAPSPKAAARHAVRGTASVRGGARRVLGQ